MRLPASAHTARPWRIHEFTGDFRLLDVWRLPTPGGPDDFPRLVDLVTSLDPDEFGSPVVRGLVGIRLKLGELLGWDDDARGTGGRVASLTERLPADLRATAVAESFAALPASLVYVTDDEAAAEVANQTVHAVLHVGWVADHDGVYRGQLAVLVKENGLFGKAYLAGIQPFRHLFVYPVLMSEIESRWEVLGRRPPRPAGNLGK